MKTKPNQTEPKSTNVTSSIKSTKGAKSTKANRGTNPTTLLARFAVLLLTLILLIPSVSLAKTIKVYADEHPVERDGWYSSMEEVSVYISTWKTLPGNYLTKKEASSLGWGNLSRSLWDVAYGKSIGGDYYGNYEEVLPDKKGRRWIECDIDFDGAYRNSKRLVFSNDGLIYYTKNHYSTFDEVQVIFDSAPASAPTAAPKVTAFSTPEPTPITVREGELYYTRDEVALYIHNFGALPVNYITKSEASELGWSNREDNLGEVAEGFVIGGEIFWNREGLLPDAYDRVWYECDVNAIDGHRGKDRLVYSNDGLIYFTNDGYKTFEQLF